MDTMIRWLKRLKRYLGGFKRTLPAILRAIVQMRSDPLFKLSNADRGLRERPTSVKRTEEERTNAAKRIIEAYKFMTADQKIKPDIYKPSYQRIDIFKKPLTPLITKLNEGDAVGLRDLLDNFFRDSISYGLFGLHIDTERTIFSKPPSLYMRALLLVDMVSRYRLLKRLMPDTKLSELHVDDIGNPYGIFVEDQFLRGGGDYQTTTPNESLNYFHLKVGIPLWLNLAGVMVVWPISSLRIVRLISPISILICRKFYASRVTSS